MVTIHIPKNEHVNGDDLGREEMEIDWDELEMEVEDDLDLD